MKIKNCRITDDYVFFWSGEFSNWYECPFRYKGITFFNSEQAFMWEKALFFDDSKTAELILKTPNPRENKKLGRNVKGFDSEKWIIVSFPIMVGVNLAKYNQIGNRYFRSARCQSLLLSTDNRILVEASPYDKIWGIGIGMEDDDCLDEHKWKGMNLLGKALMEVRKQLTYKKMKKIINWIIDQKQETIDTYPALVEPLSLKFNLEISCTQAIIDAVIEWETDSNTIESLEELLNKRFPDIVTN